VIQQIIHCSKLIDEANISALLISDPINIAYLTGFKQSDGYLLITSGRKLYFFTNFIYDYAARNGIDWTVITSNYKNNIFNLIVEVSKKLGLKRIGFETKNLSYLEYKILNSLLDEEGLKFVPTQDFIEKMRLFKNPEEIILIKKSIQIAHEAFNYIKEIADRRMSEKDLSIEIEKFLRLKGDNEIAFNTIVATGKNTAFPHHLPSDIKLQKNFFLIDLGAKCYGYCSDLTRLFFWDKMPLLFRKIYDIIRIAQELSIKKIRDGIPAAIVDKIARQYIEKKGWGKYFGHGLGHGIGYCVHEPPNLSPNSKEILKEGMVITIEPAIYLNKKFGVRIEDMVLVKSTKGELLSGGIDRDFKIF
jgi:Xaa-Pro aminopeptidase